MVSLTHKPLEMHVCIINSVATDALVQKHHARSIHNADGLECHMYCIGPVSYKKITFTGNNIRNKII